LHGLLLCEKADLSKGYQNPERKLGVTTHFSEIIELKFRKTRKAPGAFTPPFSSLPLGSKIYYGHVRYEPKWCEF